MAIGGGQAVGRAVADWAVAVRAVVREAVARAEVDLEAVVRVEGLVRGARVEARDGVVATVAVDWVGD